MTNIVELNNVTYRYGRKVFFKNLSLNLERGKIIALLGENGAGKTTLMRLLAGLSKNFTGEVSINGEQASEKIKASISFLESGLGFDKSEKLTRIIQFYVNLYSDFDLEKQTELMKFMELEASEKIGNLSKGQLEKFMLTIALSRQVPLYILDEPLSGVDIMAREKIIQALVSWVDEDATVLVSTHHIGEMERLVDEVVLLKEQEVIAQMSADDIREDYQLSLEDYYRKMYR
ncbi:ABC transporter ATP-binding protein [Vagococcus zengguangii]